MMFGAHYLGTIEILILVIGGGAAISVLVAWAIMKVIPWLRYRSELSTAQYNTNRRLWEARKQYVCFGKLVSAL